VAAAETAAAEKFFFFGQSAFVGLKYFPSGGHTSSLTHTHTHTNANENFKPLRAACWRCVAIAV
jgi:hypothetical protein